MKIDALNFYLFLMKSSEYNVPKIWLRAGKLYKETGDVESAKDALLRIIGKTKDNQDARLMLSEIYMEAGEIEEALAILDQNSSRRRLDSDEDIFIDDGEKPMNEQFFKNLMPPP